MNQRTVFRMCSRLWITWIDTSFLQIFGNYAPGVIERANLA